MTIWLFYERPGRWGLRIGRRYTTAKSVDVKIPLQGVMRATQPVCYLRGEGVVVWSNHGTHATLRKAQ